MVNSHSVIRNYKVNKVSGKLNHEGNETPYLVSTNRNKEKQAAICRISMHFLLSFGGNIDQQSIKLSGNKNRTGM